MNHLLEKGVYMLRILTKLVPMPVFERTEQFILGNYDRTYRFLRNVNPDFLEEISAKKALSIFQFAAQRTPAYREFLLKNKVDINAIKRIEDFNTLVPETDKENYIRKFLYEQRCRDGILPKHGNVDESGGTSGIATNWIHDFTEESLLLKAVDFEFNYVFDGDRKS